MTIRHDDGQFALDCWLSEADADEPKTEFSDNLSELQERAEILLRAGRFQYLELSRWNADKKDWDILRIYEPN